MTIDLSAEAPVEKKDLRMTKVFKSRSGIRPEGVECMCPTRIAGLIPWGVATPAIAHTMTIA